MPNPAHFAVAVALPGHDGDQEITAVVKITFRRAKRLPPWLPKSAVIDTHGEPVPESRPAKVIPLRRAR